MGKQKLVLTAGEIESMVGERKTHFLNDNAIRLNKSLGDAVGLAHIGVHIIEVEPGRDSTEYHIHHFEEECIYVLSGTGELDIDGERSQIGSGDFVGFPRNTAAHGLTNNGEQNLVCLVMGQRLEQDVSDYPRQGKRLYRNSGTWDLVDIESISNPR